MKYVATVDEKFVKNTIIFTDAATSGKYLYSDEACENKLTREDLLKIVEHGPFVIKVMPYGEQPFYLLPFEVDDAGSTSYANCGVLGFSGSPAAAGAILLYTKEYTA